MVLQTSHDLRPKNKSDAAIQWNNLAEAILYDPTRLEDSTFSHLETLLKAKNHPSSDETADVYLSSPSKTFHSLRSDATPRPLGPTKFPSRPQPPSLNTQPLKAVKQPTKPRSPPKAHQRRSPRKSTTPTTPPSRRPRRVRKPTRRNPECEYSDFSDWSDF